MALAAALIILALPWTYALAQKPRAPFVYAALIGGAIGAVTMGVLAGKMEVLSVEFSLARSAAAALLMGGPLGSLLGQALVALFIPPHTRRVGAALGLLVGPLLGWPPLYLFPANDPGLWHGPFWVVFWIGSWAGWCAANGAYLGAWSRSWTPTAQLVGKIAVPVVVLPAVAVGAWNFDAIRLHITPVRALVERHDAAGITWKMDRGEELPAAVRWAGDAAEGMDPAIEARLRAVLGGTFGPMVGRSRSGADYREARVSAAQSLGRIGDSQSTETLLQYANDPDEQVRQAVILALADCRQARARAVVRRAAECDPDKAVRESARQALATSPRADITPAAP